MLLFQNPFYEQRFCILAFSYWYSCLSRCGFVRIFFSVALSKTFTVADIWFNIKMFLFWLDRLNEGLWTPPISTRKFSINIFQGKQRSRDWFELGGHVVDSSCSNQVIHGWLFFRTDSTQRNPACNSHVHI